MKLSLIMAINLLLVSLTPIDKSRDALFITYERLEEPDPKREGIDRERVLVRLRNNSTCAVLIETMDAEKFLASLPSNATIVDHAKRKIQADLPDGVVVPAVKFYTEDRHHSKAPVPAWGGDMFFKFRLLGGNSMLFAIPTAYLRERLDIVMPFAYEWEQEAKAPKVIYSGDVEHRVYFHNDSLPEEIRKRIR